MRIFATITKGPAVNFPIQIFIYLFAIRVVRVRIHTETQEKWSSTTLCKQCEIHCKSEKNTKCTKSNIDDDEKKTNIVLMEIKGPTPRLSSKHQYWESIRMNQYNHLQISPLYVFLVLLLCSAHTHTYILFIICSFVWYGCSLPLCTYMRCVCACCVFFFQKSFCMSIGLISICITHKFRFSVETFFYSGWIERTRNRTSDSLYWFRSILCFRGLVMP